MKYHQIDRDLFIKTETNLWLKWSQKRCRFNSNDIYPRLEHMPFEQRYIFYLSGVDQEESFIIIRTPYEHQRNII
jgi:hypothetical protein